jgi:hypothetical protein
MDAIQHCLSVIPVPGLQLAFGIFKALYVGIQNVKTSKIRLEVLAACVAELLIAINKQFVEGKLAITSSEVPLEGLVRYTLDGLSAIAMLIGSDRLLEEICAYIEKQAKHSFVKAFVLADDRNLTIEGYHRRISACVYSLQVSQQYSPAARKL